MHGNFCNFGQHMLQKLMQLMSAYLEFIHEIILWIPYRVHLVCGTFIIFICIFILIDFKCTVGASSRYHLTMFLIYTFGNLLNLFFSFRELAGNAWNSSVREITQNRISHMKYTRRNLGSLRPTVHICGRIFDTFRILSCFLDILFFSWHFYLF